MGWRLSLPPVMQRVLLGASGVVAAALAVHAFGLCGYEDAQAAILSGSLGMACVPLAIALAAFVSSPRCPVRAGLALGCLAPSGTALGFLWRGDLPWAAAAWTVVAAACARFGWHAVRSSNEPAAARLMLTAAGIGALLVGAVATLCWWPRHYTFGGWGERVQPTWQVVASTILLRVALRDLTARRTRALFALGGAGLMIALSPHLGAVSAGCTRYPGPLELLVLPSLVAPAILLVWAGPVARSLRAASSAEVRPRRTLS